MLPISRSTEATSTLLLTPAVSQALQTLKSVPAPPLSATQGVPIIPPVLRPLSQAGTLTLRISPSGLKSTASETDSKIVGQPRSTSSLIPLQTGSFALLQFPAQKSASDPIVKEVGSLEIKNTSERDEFHAVHIEEKTSYAQEVGAIESDLTVSNIKIEENTLPAKRTDSHSEGTMCDRNAVTPEMIERDADMVEKLSNGASGSQPDAVSSDHSYIGEEIQCDEMKFKKKQNVKCSENTLDEVSYSSENVSEECHKTTFLAHNSVQKPMDATHLENSNGEQTQSVETQSFATNSADQTHLEMEEIFVDVQPQKPRKKHKVYMDSTEKLQKKTKSSLSRYEKDLKALWRNRKPNGDSVTAVERGWEEEKEKPKVSSAKTQNNTSRKKYLDSAQETLAKRDADFQVNCNTSAHETSTTGFQEDDQTVKDSLSQISRPCSKTSTRSVPLENQNMAADEHVKKLVKCTKQNTVKTNHCRKDYANIIDITLDDSEKDEKTDDSADETVDEISGYRSEDVVNIETLVSICISLKWKGQL